LSRITPVGVGTGGKWGGERGEMRGGGGGVEERKWGVKHEKPAFSFTEKAGGPPVDQKFEP